MDLANFEEFKQEMERLRQQTRDMSRGRKAAEPLSPEELVKVAAQLAKDAGELARLSRAKFALLLRRDRALKAPHLRDSAQSG